MSNVAKLVNDGKKLLGEDHVFSGLSALYSGFFNILERGNYSTEPELLDSLGKWATNQPVYTSNTPNVSVTAKIFRTHQRYIALNPRDRREFGDVTFVLVFSNFAKREAFANSFQLKVDETIIKAYNSLFSASNCRQLDFYRTRLIERLDPIYDNLICDFLHYFLIGSKWLHPIAEIPLSYTWLDDNQSAYWILLRSLLTPRIVTSKTASSGLDTMIRKQFLTTGINLRRILPLCTPSLRDILEPMLGTSIVNLYDNKKKVINESDRNREPPRKKDVGFVPPEFPLSSSVVIATEVFFREQ